MDRVQHRRRGAGHVAVEDHRECAGAAPRGWRRRSPRPRGRRGGAGPRGDRSDAPGDARARASTAAILRASPASSTRCRARPIALPARRRAPRRAPPRRWCCRCRVRRPPEEVGSAGDRLHAEGHGGDAAFLVHRGLRDDVVGRHVEGEVEDLEAEAEAGADLVDRGAAGGEVLEHLPVDLRRIGRHAPRCDAVAPGEDADERAVDGRLRLCPARRRAIPRAIRAARGCLPAW